MFDDRRHGLDQSAGQRQLLGPAPLLAVAAASDRTAVRQWTPHGVELVAGGRTQRRLPRLLLLPLYPWPQGRMAGRNAVAHCCGGDRSGGPYSAGPRRYAQQALWAEGGRGRRAPQPDPRSGRRQVSLRPQLGDAGLGRAPSVVGGDRLAVVGPDVRASEGHHRPTSEVACARLPSRPSWSWLANSSPGRRPGCVFWV